MLGSSGETTIDGLLHAARWFFRVPHDDEDAGGEATLGRTTFEGRRYLVAVRGSSWRRAGKNLYNQERYERFGWRLGHTLEAAHVASPAQWSAP